MWTDQEEWYLQENWGKYSIPTIANNLGRSLNAVKIRAQRLGLGPALMGGDYITLNQLLFAVKGTNAGGNYTMKSWVKNRGLPVHKRKVINNSTTMFGMYRTKECRKSPTGCPCPLRRKENEYA